MRPDVDPAAFAAVPLAVLGVVQQLRLLAPDRHAALVSLLVDALVAELALKPPI